MFDFFRRYWHGVRWFRVTLLLLLIFVVAIVIYVVFRPVASEALYTEVQQGEFEVRIDVQGELEAKNSIDILGPTEHMRSKNFRINDIKIEDLVPEGTIVDSGDYVGRLDRSVLSTQLKNLADEVEKAQQQLLKTTLDTTLTLRELRSSLQNMEYERKERQIILEQSKFEPPATVRQAELNLEKTERSLAQARENYKLKSLQAQSTVREAELNLDRIERQEAELKSMLEKFVVTAPKHGMVIYAKEWSGKKRKVGSTISPWETTIATLPDLSVMISKTYVNEIDISKIKVGQKVEVGVDAFPERKYSGVVEEVANVGEQISGSDAKVFEVRVRVQEQDSILRPAMTTNNSILVFERTSSVYCPLECLYTNDTISYVYLAAGIRRQVLTGASNDYDIEILEGLQPGEKLYLSAPQQGDTFGWQLLNRAN